MTKFSKRAQEFIKKLKKQGNWFENEDEKEGDIQVIFRPQKSKKQSSE